MMLSGTQPAASGLNVGIADFRRAANDRARRIRRVRVHRVERPAQEVVLPHGRAREAADHVVEEPLVVFVLAVLEIGVPGPLGPDLRVEAGHEARGRVLGRVVGAHHRGHEDPVQVAAERTERRADARRQKRVIGLNPQRAGAESAVRRRVRRIAVRVSELAVPVELVADVVAHAPHRGVALDLWPDVRCVVRELVAVAADPRRESGSR